MRQMLWTGKAPVYPKMATTLGKAPPLFACVLKWMMMDDDDRSKKKLNSPDKLFSYRSRSKYGCP